MNDWSNKMPIFADHLNRSHPFHATSNHIKNRSRVGKIIALCRSPRWTFNQSFNESIWPGSRRILKVTCWTHAKRPRHRAHLMTACFNKQIRNEIAHMIGVNAFKIPEKPRSLHMCSLCSVMYQKQMLLMAFHRREIHLLLNTRPSIVIADNGDIRQHNDKSTLLREYTYYRTCNV